MKRPEKEGGHAGKHGHQKLTGLNEAIQALATSQLLFVSVSIRDLRALRDALRELQEPYEKTFWRLEECLGRIDTELLRRAS